MLFLGTYIPKLRSNKDIQNIHINLLPLQVCRRLWQGCRLGVNTCPYPLISLFVIKYPSSYLFKPSFVDFLLLYTVFTVSVSTDTETCPQVCYKLYVGHIQTIHTALLPLQVCGRSWKG